MNFKLIVSLILIAFLLSPCTTSRNRSAGSLSNAMEKSSDDYEGERKINAVVTEDEEDEEEEEEEYIHAHRYIDNDQINYNNKNPLFITYEKKKSKNINLGRAHWLGFQFGTGILSSDSFYGISSFALTGNQYTGKKRSFSYELGCDYAPLQTTETATFDPLEDEIVQGLEGGIVSVFAGIKKRWYTTPKYTFLGNYFAVGARIHSMFFEYKNELQIDEFDEYGILIDTDYVKHDQIWGVDFNVATAVNIMQFKYLRIGIEFNPGVTIWWFDTYQGFTNDVFAPFVYLKTNFRFLLGGG